MIPNIITKEFLNSNSNYVFVFGDNLLRKGYGGAAELRDLPNTYGFITKKKPTNENNAFYKPDEYFPVYCNEVMKLGAEMIKHQDKTYLISKLGFGLANRYHIWEKVVSLFIKDLSALGKVKFLF